MPQRALSDTHYPVSISTTGAAGPQVVRITEVDPFQGKDDDATKRNILNHYHRAESEVNELPCEGKTP